MKERTLQFGLGPLDTLRARAVARSRRYLTGFTLMEMMVVIAIVATLAVFAIPAARMLLNSFQSDGNTRAMINSTLGAARAIAAKEQKYAGIRFQYAYNPRNSNDILEAAQYMIFIINDADKTNLQPGFCAIDGMEPVKLPDTVGIIDLKVRTSGVLSDSLPEESVTDTSINDPAGLRNATTFSIIFSPSGRLIIHDVRVRNRNGVTTNSSDDDIFNTQTNIENNNIGMFYQDDTPPELGQELSRNSFIIYDTNILKKINQTARWTNYLRTLTPLYVNPYTGTIINKQ